jgi:hypothetical protein
VAPTALACPTVPDPGELDHGVIASPASAGRLVDSWFQRWAALFLAGFLLLARAGAAAGGDLASDTWVATDALGRQVPTFEQVGPSRSGRVVGMFYFLWHGAHVQGGPYDVSRILAKDPEAMHKPDSPLWGPLHAPHHWGESIFGYYLTDDRAVLRKHAQMLSDAGVDFVAFDVTNQLTYPTWYRALLQEWSEVRRLGNRTPQIVFLCPFGDPAKVVRELWRDLYRDGHHRDLWFLWEDKPLILADAAFLQAKDDGESQQIRDFFTFRKPQPDYFRGPTQPGMWSWLEVYPQHVFRNAQGEREQMSVGVAQNAVDRRLGSMSEAGARGRSYHQGRTDSRPEAVRWGLNLAEQFDHALREDPRCLFVTGWNEWIAGRFAEFNGVRLPVMFVDQFDQEHSRDIEPMRGGHGDDYYYQFASYVRRYKGARPLPSLKSRPIRIDGRFKDWRGVEPVYRDTIGDAVRRQHPGWGTNLVYTNVTGRNDLVAAKISVAARGMSFYVRTSSWLTPASSTNWMLLLLDLDANAATGWMGYDYLINGRRPHPRQASVARNLGSAFAWETVGLASLRVGEDQLELSIPWEVLGRTGPPAMVDFKWADQCLQAGDWSDFTLNGDAAPNDRYNYRAIIRR